MAFVAQIDDGFGGDRPAAGLFFDEAQKRPEKIPHDPVHLETDKHPLNLGEMSIGVNCFALLTLARRWFKGRYFKSPMRRNFMKCRWIAAIGIAGVLALTPSAHAQTVHLSYSGNSGQNIPFWV